MSSLDGRRGPRHRWAMQQPRRVTAPASIDELHQVKKLMRDLFGENGNTFYDVGLWHIGRFLDRLGQVKAAGTDPVAPHRRPQEVFAVAPTLTEAIAVFRGPKRIYSMAGVAPGQTRGYRVRFDKWGRVRGYESPAGIFSRHFPGDPGQWS